MTQMSLEVFKVYPLTKGCLTKYFVSEKMIFKIKHSLDFLVSEEQNLGI